MKSPEELALDLPTHLQDGLKTIAKTYRDSERADVSECSWEDLTHSAKLFCTRLSKEFIPGSLQYILYPKDPDIPPFKPRYGIDITCRKVCVTNLATKPIFQIAPIPDEFFHILDEVMTWATDVCRADASKEGSVGEESQSMSVGMMLDDQGEDEEDEDEEMSTGFPEDCCQDCGNQTVECDGCSNHACPGPSCDDRLHSCEFCSSDCCDSCVEEDHCSTCEQWVCKVCVKRDPKICPGCDGLLDREATEFGYELDAIAYSVDDDDFFAV